jgi:hypothetical protein
MPAPRASQTSLSSPFVKFNHFPTFSLPQSERKPSSRRQSNHPHRSFADHITGILTDPQTTHHLKAQLLKVLANPDKLIYYTPRTLYLRVCYAPASAAKEMNSANIRKNRYYHVRKKN